MKDTAWGTPKPSPGMPSNPRPLSWIVASVGALAVFLIYASWVLVSYPIGATVQGYFNGLDSSGKLDLTVSPIHEASVDVHLNKSSDLVDNKPSSNSEIEQTPSKSNSEVELNSPASENTNVVKGIETSDGTTSKSQVSVDVHLNKSSDLVDNIPSSDLQSPTVSSNREIEQTPTKSNSEVELNNPASESTDVVKGIETSNGTASKSQESVPSLLGKSEDDVNSSLPAKANPQIDLPSSETIPVAATNASNVLGNIRTEEPSSKDLINPTGAVIPASNETTVTSDDSKSTAVLAPVEKPNNISDAGSVNSGCDLYNGNWVHDPLGPLYTNNTCPVITQMQNCQGNGRPDKDYENWRWKPSQCALPRFDPKKFLELMRGKTLAFIGDSVARNQMESMLCILWQVEAPKNRGNRHMQRYYFRSASVMIVRIWSSWLVKVTNEPFDFAEAGVDKLHLDFPDEKLMEYIPTFDVVVLSSGHWFAKKSVYILNNEIVGGQLWWPDNSRPMKIDGDKAYGISVETILTAIGTIPNYTGLTIVRSYSPDHYEGGAWNTGGSCTGKVKPLAPNELVENGHTNVMHEQQVSGFNRAIKKATNKSKLKLMDITQVFQYRHDGHPGPYRSTDPNKITKRGPDGRPPPQDCLHWCMPGPVDTWNELVLEIIRREYEGTSTS